MMPDLLSVLHGDKAWAVFCGTVRAACAVLPDAGVHCCVTSPPYYGQRSYLPADHPSKGDELGREAEADCRGWATGGRCGACYVCRLTAALAEVRRVLREDGTLWLNVAGKYAGHGQAGYRPKELINTPALLAESLRADGWHLRSEVTLTKISPMPEPCRDRPTRATEKLYLLAKSPAYYYDREAERVPSAPSTLERDRYTRVTPGNATEQYAVRHDHDFVSDPAGRNLWDYWDDEDDAPPGVWQWRPEGGKTVEHCATFPRWLPRRCLRLGASLRGVCPSCGSPWVRDVERADPPPQTDRHRHPAVGRSDSRTVSGGTRKSTPVAGRGGDRASRRLTSGWSPSCACGGGPVPPVVMDCFSGSGTTGVVARELGMRYVGIELFDEWAEASRRRIGGTSTVSKQTSLFPEGGDL